MLHYPPIESAADTATVAFYTPASPPQKVRYESSSVFLAAAAAMPSTATSAADPGVLKAKGGKGAQASISNKAGKKRKKCGGGEWFEKALRGRHGCDGDHGE
eukprot:GFKZ01015833.1.p1 GENE.GFKZ01015833.1~~GFKZ01015833.1.p1  ORF type:complete len:102 (+),score=11.78 GFKZ01015833.1:69-374(+)